MILTRLLKSIVRPGAPPLPGDDPQLTAQPCVLNVGGGKKQIPIPSHYDEWTHLLLDIAPGPDVDVVLDARQLLSLDPAQFDAIYCSHNLEHYYRHDCVKVLAGFQHVLKPEAYAEIRVPDMTSVLQAMVTRQLDIDDVLYTAAAGPITVHDVIYGWGIQIERSGVDFYAHRRGFTPQSLGRALQDAGFAQVHIAASAANFEIRALAFKTEPTAAQRVIFGI